MKDKFESYEFVTAGALNYIPQKASAMRASPTTGLLCLEESLGEQASFNISETLFLIMGVKSLLLALAAYNHSTSSK